MVHNTQIALLDALRWQFEAGADVALLEDPLNRFDMPASAPKLKQRGESNIKPVQAIPDFVPQEAAPDVARALAQKCDTLEALRDAINLFDLCALKKGARNTVFCDGNPKARVMIIGEAPGRDEDYAGRPFVGQAGQLLDKMFNAIGLDRKSNVEKQAVYITNVMPWRPPQNRTPEPSEIAMMLPFLERHIALVNPDFLVLMGNTACQAVLQQKGITKLRGVWQRAFDRATLPMFHPAFLLRDPLRKREAWKDLQDLQKKMQEGSHE